MEGERGGAGGSESKLGLWFGCIDYGFGVKWSKLFLYRLVLEWVWGFLDWRYGCLVLLVTSSCCGRCGEVGMVILDVGASDLWLVNWVLIWVDGGLLWRLVKWVDTTLMLQAIVGCTLGYSVGLRRRAGFACRKMTVWVSRPNRNGRRCCRGGSR